MIKLIRTFKNVEFTHELMEHILRLNISRITFASIVFVLFQFFNIGRYKNDPAQYFGGLTVGALGILIFVLSLILRKKPEHNAKRGHIFQLTFWIVMMLGMIPYLIHDIRVGLEVIRPINLTLYAIAVITVPIFMLSELTVVFSVFFTVNMGIAVFTNAPFSYYLNVLTVCIGGLAIAVIFQYQYLQTICRLQTEIRIDGLTGILNRRAGMEKIETMLELSKRSHEPLSLFMVDIDFFKKYNDTFGHLKGDYALKMVSKAIQSVFSRASDIVCRYGGEEFLICVSCADHEAKKLARKISAALSGLQIQAADGSVSEYLTVSVGYTVYMPDRKNLSADVSAIIAQADTALYLAKNSGRNTVVACACQSEDAV